MVTSALDRCVFSSTRLDSRTSDTSVGGGYASLERTCTPNGGGNPATLYPKGDTDRLTGRGIGAPIFGGR